MNEEGLDRFVELLDRASPMFDYYLEKMLSERDSDLEEKVHSLKEILPVLLALRSSTQRSLYVRRLAERIGVREEAIFTELRSLSTRPSQRAPQKGLNGRVSRSEGGRSYGDLQLLNLLVHHPGTVARLMGCECTILISDPAIMQVVEGFFQRYRSDGTVSPENLEQALESEAARIRLREVLVGPSFYTDREVEQAIGEIERKAHQKKLSESFKMAKGDIEGLNRLLKLKAQGPVGS